MKFIFFANTNYVRNITLKKLNSVAFIVLEDVEASPDLFRDCRKLECFADFFDDNALAVN